MKDDTTAKRLRKAAQGCRASRLPWVTGLAITTPQGLRQFVIWISGTNRRSTSIVFDLLERRNPVRVCIHVNSIPG